ncbi:MAG TPA: response regulator [Pyrinomonadaceae bacterium]|nr:response regulator [Pyrinomonadaceae bacterium]
MEKISHRILIVEDDADSADALQILLEMNQHEVEIASDGEAALIKADKFIPHIIICDIGLPGNMNGHDVASAIRANERLCSVYMIALSGYGEARDIQNSENTGFNSHLVKPPDFEKLLSMIENLRFF